MESSQSKALHISILCLGIQVYNIFWRPRQVQPPLQVNGCTWPCLWKVSYVHGLVAVCGMGSFPGHQKALGILHLGTQKLLSIHVNEANVLLLHFMNLPLTFIIFLSYNRNKKTKKTNTLHLKNTGWTTGNPIFLDSQKSQLGYSQHVGFVHIMVYC